MNEIVMIPIAELYHHPQNPRLDLGDLTELTESIKSQGVLQNLTVVHAVRDITDEEWAQYTQLYQECQTEELRQILNSRKVVESNRYWVVIGNRRMEAAKLAGLEELPCAIVEMDPTDQIATMLTENMHRSDLTLFEQAQGIQMMMDLGLTEAQISEITGFSRTTVKRRAEMAKLDKETLKSKCAQLTMDDIDLMTKVKDLDTRNKLLKDHAGSTNFKWYVENEIKEQKRVENYQLIRGILLQAGCVEQNYRKVENFWSTYDFLPYKDNIDLDTYEAGTNILPEDDRELFFYREYSSVKFFAEKRKESAEEEEDEETAEEKAKQKEVQDAWTRLREIEEHAKTSRDKFVKTLVIKQKDNRKALEWMLIALSIGEFDAWGSMIPDSDEEDSDTLEYSLKWMREQVETNPVIYAEIMNKVFFQDASCIKYEWRTSEKPEYEKNLAMNTGYEWLEEFGYQISDEERAYLDGTLDCYGKVEE